VSAQDAPDPVFRSLEEGLTAFAPHYVVIANKTVDHLKAVEELARLRFSGDVLVDKPLFHVDAAIPPKAFKSLYVGYQLRFHPALVELRETLQGEQILSCHCYCGQYLPDWRPSSDYRSSYSARVDQGGGVLRDLSHELDYLQWLFGDIRQVKAIGGKLSPLETTSEDIVGIVASFDRCPVVTLQLNYVDRTLRRECVVTAAEHSFRVDLVAPSLQVNGSSPRMFSIAHGELLQRMHREIVSEKPHAVCTGQEGLRTLSWIAQIESQLGVPG
jgi:predicted dehydrogenase